jgi:hypothetical protein
MKAGPKAAVDQTPLPFCPRSVGCCPVRCVLREVRVGAEGHGCTHTPLRLRDWQRDLVGSVLDADPQPRLVTDLGGVGDAHYRWPVERCAVGVERRPVDGLIACAARPGGVPAAVTEAGLTADQDLARAKGVAVRASRRRVGDPLLGRRSYKLAQHA